MSRQCSYCGLPVGCSWNPNANDSEPLYCCFGCRFAAEVTHEQGEAGAAVWTLTKLGLAVFFTLNVLCFTMALWSDSVYGATESADSLAIGYENLLRWLGLLFSLPVLFLLGGPLVANAVDELRHGRFSTDLLLVSGVLASFAYSATSVVRGNGDVYFEVGCVILVTVTLGRWLEARHRLQATQALDQLERLLPDRVRLVTDGRECSIPLRELTAPACVRVLPGERFPADGRLLTDVVSVDQQVLTGESLPVTKQLGDEILGGTLNLDGDVLLDVTAAPSETAVARMIALVKAARLTQGRFQRISDRISSGFFPVVAMLALVAFAIHWRRTSLDAGLMSALAVVLISCPCALGLATPLAVWTALGAAARRQVLFRNGEALERLADVRELLLDKTGTLTTGESRVRQLVCDESTPPEDAAMVAQALAESSTHPFSRAIVNWVHGTQCGATCSDACERPQFHWLQPPRTLAGLGVTGVTSLSPVVALGNERLMSRLDFSASAAFRSRLVADAGHQPLALLGWNECVRAAFVFSEELRPSVRELLAECRAKDLPVTILTGDHARRASSLSEELHVPVLAELLPDQKADIVKQRQSWHPVAMVGDGINDAAALTAAHVGISLGAGTDVSRDAAAVCLLNNDLAQLPWAIELARRTVRTIRGNLLWAFAYNGVGIALAMLGLLNPAFAALLMVASNLLVVRRSRALEAAA